MAHTTATSTPMPTPTALDQKPTLEYVIYALVMAYLLFCGMLLPAPVFN